MIKHKQHPAKAARTGRVLANLKAKAAAGSITLYHLDACGFAPTLPVGSSWCLPSRRKLIRYEAPQGRRVNTLAADRPSYRLRGPRAVVLDNAGLHTSRIVRQARQEFPTRGM